MTRMQKHWDSIFGAVGMVGTITIGHVNLAIGCAVGIATLFVMLLRARREWRHRDRPPEE